MDVCRASPRRAARLSPALSSNPLPHTSSCKLAVSASRAGATLRWTYRHRGSLGLLWRVPVPRSWRLPPHHHHTPLIPGSPGRRLGPSAQTGRRRPCDITHSRRGPAGAAGAVAVATRTPSRGQWLPAARRPTAAARMRVPAFSRSPSAPPCVMWHSGQRGAVCGRLASLVFGASGSRCGVFWAKFMWMSLVAAAGTS